MKRFLTAGLALAMILALCLIPADAAVPGSAENPIISKSYMEQTEIPDLQEGSLIAVSDRMDGILSGLMARMRLEMELLREQVALRTGLQGYTLEHPAQTETVRAGGTVSMASGCCFTLLSGSGTLTVNKGTVLDLSTGTAIASGSTVQRSVRCLCAEGTRAVLTAAERITVLVDGYCTVAGRPDAADETPFTDLAPFGWYRDAVAYCYRNNLFSGTSPTTFSPEETMTRAMLVTVLYRLHGSPEISASSAFSDVADPNAYYYAPVVWASSCGIVGGYGDGRFGPDDDITREQIAVILYRYHTYLGLSGSADESLLQRFSDSGEISDWARQALAWCVGKRIINGTTAGELLPTENATRAQVATIFMNFREYIRAI